MDDGDGEDVPNREGTVGGGTEGVGRDGTVGGGAVDVTTALGFFHDGVAGGGGELLLV